jgi:glycosyltransferase involved in cell wall biosynthesis
LRVLHLLSGDLWAGAEVATYHLLMALAAEGGVEAQAVVLNPGELSDRLAARGLLAAVEPESGRGFAALAGAVRARLASADLVHAHGYKQDVLAALAGRPWLSTQHGRPEPQRGRALLRAVATGAVDRTLQRLRARRVVAVSSEIERWLHPRVGRSKVVRVSNGIVDPVPEGRVPAWSERPRRIGVLARLFPVKCVDRTIEAVARCRDIELEIVGDGPEAPRLRALACASGAGERVHFTGFDPEPGPRLARWRALLVPSLHEGNPICVLEALAWGTPVVAGPLPGVAEILDGRGGWCLPDRRTTTWQEAILRVAADSGPGPAASTAGRARFVEAFTATLAARRMRQLYEETLAQR